MYFYTKTADWRSPITFWRVPIFILEAEIVLGALYRKGVIPKKGGTLGSREATLFCSYRLRVSHVVAVRLVITGAMPKGLAVAMHYICRSKSVSVMEINWNSRENLYLQ